MVGVELADATVKVTTQQGEVTNGSARVGQAWDYSWKSQIGRASLNEQQSNLRFRDFGFEMQDSSNLKISLSLRSW